MATKELRIVGANGEPLMREVLDKEISAGGMASIRHPWHDSVADNLTPTRLAAILRGAADGNAQDYLTLAEEMEERDGHYASVLSTRKLALAGLDVRVDALSDDAKDIEIADAVREIVQQPDFGDLLFDLTDALGKGYAVAEIIWNRSGKRWTPERFEYRDPRFFTWDRETGKELRLLDEADAFNGIPLPPCKFIVHRPRLRSGLPSRGGLARLAAVAYMCKAWTWKDWMAFADVFGMPMRVGTHSPDAKEADIRKLMRAVANLGSDAAAVISDTTKIEFQAAPNTSGSADFFERLATFWDKQVSKAVLGQTMTADDGASLSQAQVHDAVRRDLLKADAKGLQNTLNEYLVRPFVDLNYGGGRYPSIVLHVPDLEDLQLLVSSLEKLVPLGLEVEQSVIRDKLGLPDPDDAKGVKLLRAPTAGGLGVADVAQAENREGAKAAPALPTAFPDQAALTRAVDVLDDGVLDAQMADLLQPLIDLANHDPQAALDAIASALPDMDDAALQNMLARVLFVAEAWGRVNG